MNRERKKIRLWVAIVLSLLGGAAMASQALVNGALGTKLGNGFVAATISNTSGIVLITVIALFSPRVRAGWKGIAAGVRERRIPWLFTLAGLMGGFFVTSQGLFVTVLGVASFTVAFIAGNSVGAIFMDMWGVGPAGRRHPSPKRLVGAALGIVAVVVAGTGRFGDPQSVWLLAIPMVIGFGVSWQQAANGRLSVEAHTPMTATYLNFLTGTAIMLVFTFVAAPMTGLPTHYPMDWWLYLGGPLGVFFVTITSMMIRVTGVLVFTLVATLGQLAAALTFDLLIPGRADGLAVFLGVVVMAGAIIIATWRNPRKLISR